MKALDQPVHATTTDVGSETGTTLSAAIVSVYNSWSSLESTSLRDDDDGLSLEDRYASLPEGSVCADELLERLKKRLKPNDLPPIPQLRPRVQPNCRFLNYMGTTRVAVDIIRERVPPPLFVFDMDIQTEDTTLVEEESERILISWDLTE